MDDEIRKTTKWSRDPLQANEIKQQLLKGGKQVG
jgi:hypothetical protein